VTGAPKFHFREPSVGGPRITVKARHSIERELWDRGVIIGKENVRLL
jgi:hypothetical protein